MQWSDWSSDVCSSDLFYGFSKYIKVKRAENVIKFAGVGSALAGLLVVVPTLHDSMVTLSSIMTLLAFFYVTIFTIKSKLTILKILSILFLAVHYFACYMYFGRTFLDYLPIMQKAIHLIQIIWVVGLMYFTSEKNFESIKK